MNARWGAVSSFNMPRTIWLSSNTNMESLGKTLLLGLFIGVVFIGFIGPKLFNANNTALNLLALFGLGGLLLYIGKAIYKASQSSKQK